jgi:hypothetical protein
MGNKQIFFVHYFILVKLKSFEVTIKPIDYNAKYLQFLLMKYISIIEISRVANNILTNIVFLTILKTKCFLIFFSQVRYPN